MFDIGFIGCGNMGEALIRAACKSIDPKKVLITDINLDKANALAEELGCVVAQNNADVVIQSHYIMLGVKPHLIKGVLSSLTEVIKSCEHSAKVFVSMAAGVSIESIVKYLNLDIKIPVIRIMPNTPVAIGCGLILVSTNQELAPVSEKQLHTFKMYMKAAGSFDTLEEQLIDAATVVASSAPAFGYLFIEALADGAVLAGVPRDKAIIYAANALKGSAEMVLQTQKHPGALKDAVCSPGGSTIEGIAVLEQQGLRSAAINAVVAAYEKNKKLG